MIEVQNLLAPGESVLTVNADIELARHGQVDLVEFKTDHFMVIREEVFNGDEEMVRIVLKLIKLSETIREKIIEKTQEKIREKIREKTREKIREKCIILQN